MALTFGNSIIPINSIGQLREQGFSTQKLGITPKGVSFADLLMNTIGDTNGTAAKTSKDVLDLVTGATGDDLHTIEINAAKADLALRTMVSVRNKLMDAYSEVMRITL